MYICKFAYIRICLYTMLVLAENTRTDHIMQVVNMYKHMFMCMHTHMCIRIYVYIYIYTHVYVCIHMNSYICVYVRIYIYVCV